ncbi:probable nedd8-conjugating enzyme ubc12-like [Phtheirospermum japonicum]|uniref:Probable nedd8-conjugating enzyme ubc12-like n=1 Tax=Phtheirospermum japonicum TaxID=374723 RepID=A0A830C131_9LAMI|nr:probable nedd8-conjugating enzyme ubc12-like [Phtheirospermum japonicum]
MIKLFKVKEKQRELAESTNGKPPVKKQSAGELRLQKDISELNLPKTCSIAFPNGKDDLMNFEVTIRPDEGYYLSGTFVFSFQISPIYPHEAPKVKCKTKVYHPNIDLDGNDGCEDFCTSPVSDEVGAVLRFRGLYIWTLILSVVFLLQKFEARLNFAVILCYYYLKKQKAVCMLL